MGWYNFCSKMPKWLMVVNSLLGDWTGMAQNTNSQQSTGAVGWDGMVSM